MNDPHESPKHLPYSMGKGMALHSDNKNLP